MARTMAPNSAGSQFFIMVAPAPHLDGQYAAFGQVTGRRGGGHRHLPGAHRHDERQAQETVVIQSIRVDTQGVDYPEPEKR